ncbi:MAG: TIGR03084 family protein [Acidimicrobiales bacterium]|nr:TIGR03084 family protein [Acidimicrobiales bacterium]
MDVADVLADLLAEHAALDEVVAPLRDEQWLLDTPSPRWTVRDQLAHLTYFDHAAAMAIDDAVTGSTSFADALAALGEVRASAEGVDDLTVGPFVGRSAAENLAAWREGRDRLTAAAAALANDTRVPWYGPSMGSKSFLTARLMETWAHGQDICDTVGAGRKPTDRLRHIAQLGYITRGWTYVNRNMDVPEGDVRVVLESPSGETWAWGPDDETSNVITGPAESFCLVVTQRRNVADVDLDVRGPAATDWLSMAQAFAGPPTDSPTPGGFTA